MVNEGFENKNLSRFAGEVDFLERIHDFDERYGVNGDVVCFDEKMKMRPSGGGPGFSGVCDELPFFDALSYPDLYLERWI